MDLLDSLKEKTGEHVTSNRHRRKVWNTKLQVQAWRKTLNKRPEFR